MLEEGFTRFSEELPRVNEGIGILLEDGSKIIGQRKNHPIYKGEYCYMLDNTEKQSKMLGWIYISDLIKMN